MDITALAADTVKQLAPALPALILIGTKAGEEAATRLTAAVFDGAKKLWDRLRPHAEQQPALLEAARDLAAQPDDADAQGALRLQLRKLFEAQPQLVQELSGVVIQQRVEGKGIIVAGRDLRARDIDIRTS